MPPLRRLIFTGFLALAPLSASATTMLDYQGFARETGGFPPSAPGDTLLIPCIVDALSQTLGIDLTAQEVTGYISGLVSTGAQEVPGGIQSIAYSSAHIAIYRDAGRDHDYGANPPNATMPSTFTNGQLCLGGNIDNFVLYFDPVTGAGAYQADVSFTEGDCLAQLQTLRADGFTFGGVLSRVAAAQNVPPGYDLELDGTIEVQEKVEPPPCELSCFGLEEVDMDFPRKPVKHFGAKDGKFEIEGQFSACADFGPLDPTQEEVRIKLGSYEQVFPVGSFHLKGRDEDDSEQREYKYSNDDGTATITEVELELSDGGAWEFEIHGRGLTRQTLVGNGLTLVVQLTIRDMTGTTQAELEQEKKHLSFEGDDEPCESGDDVARGPIGRASQLGTEGYGLVPATPNPFNATTTIELRMKNAGPVSLDVYDVRGRMVRSLQHGPLPAGEHRFVWDGKDVRGATVSSGVYFYHVQTLGFAQTLKMVLAK